MNAHARRDWGHAPLEILSRIKCIEIDSQSIFRPKYYWKFLLRKKVFWFFFVVVDKVPAFRNCCHHVLMNNYHIFVADHMFVYNKMKPGPELQSCAPI